MQPTPLDFEKRPVGGKTCLHAARMNMCEDGAPGEDDQRQVARRRNFKGMPEVHYKELEILAVHSCPSFSTMVGCSGSAG